MTNQSLLRNRELMKCIEQVCKLQRYTTQGICLWIHVNPCVLEAPNCSTILYFHIRIYHQESSRTAGTHRVVPQHAQDRYIWPMEFGNYEEAAECIQRAFCDYNNVRIHSSIGYMTPNEFYEKWKREHGKEVAPSTYYPAE